MQRKYPRAYDMLRLARWLELLHVYSVPLQEISRRRLSEKVCNKQMNPDDAKLIASWKERKDIDISDEMEYVYLMRDLGLIRVRVLDPTTDLMVPLGGDGPPLKSFIANHAKMYYLSKLGQELYKLYSDGDMVAYENVLFWSLFRCGKYIPLLQQVICEPDCYRSRDIKELMRSNDSTSINCALSWGRFFGIFSKNATAYALKPVMVARRILSASVLEINHMLSTHNGFNNSYYVKELTNHLLETFRLTPTAVDFSAVLLIIFRHSKRHIVKGYTSGRADKSIDDVSKIQILKFSQRLSPNISGKPTLQELGKILPYSRLQEVKNIGQ